MTAKKKEPDAAKQPDSKRMIEIKRLLNAKALSEENQEILLKFDGNHPDLAFDEIEAILVFVGWLEKNSYIIFDAKRMVRVRLEIE